MLTKKQQAKELEALAARSDEEIDLSDIPEIIDWSGAVRGKFARPVTRHISIRLSAVDLAKAEQLAAAKGLPYQTYIKSLLHEALERETAGRV
jgi:predicted DNA binding CopG/RHH family protein